MRQLVNSRIRKEVHPNIRFIERAFGSDPKALGIIVVKDLPSDYSAKRERLLKLADRFASLSESVKDKYVDSKSRYRCVSSLFMFTILS